MEAETTVILLRYHQGTDYTRGVLLVEDKVLHTIEPAWKDNERNKSSIPKGEYYCTYLPKSFSGKYKKVYHVTEVEGRSGILFHNGNLPSHTKGCILVGTDAGVLAGHPAVLGSRIGMATLRDTLDNKNFNLVVI